MWMRRLSPLLLAADCSGSSSPVHMDDGPVQSSDASIESRDGAVTVGPDTGVGRTPDAQVPVDGAVPHEGDAQVTGPDAGPVTPSAYPFRTRGRYIVNALGERVKLAS